MFDYTERSVLVTGASGGIGQAIARAFYEAGAGHVFLSGRRRDVLEDLQRSLGPRAHVLVADLSRHEAPLEDAIQGKNIDILVNNAGVTRDALLLRMSNEDWEHVLHVNLTSTFRLTKACLKSMLKRRWGRIITITSVVASCGNPGQANYVASKAALTGFSKSLALEVARRNVTVNCIAPGMIETAMTQAMEPKVHEAMLATIPVGRIGVPEDVATGALFLASEGASFITGQTLHINGGQVMA